MTELEDLEVFGSAPVQAVATIDGREFYFRARHDAWSAEIANSLGGLPSDGFPGGFFRCGFAQNASYLATARVHHLIDRTGAEYLRLRGTLAPRYFDTGLPAHEAKALGVEDALRLALALRAPRTLGELAAAVGAPEKSVEDALATLEETAELRYLVHGSSKYWLLHETHLWLTFK